MNLVLFLFLELQLKGKLMFHWLKEFKKCSQVGLTNSSRILGFRKISIDGSRAEIIHHMAHQLPVDGSGFHELG